MQECEARDTHRIGYRYGTSMLSTAFLSRSIWNIQDSVECERAVCVARPVVAIDHGAEKERVRQRFATNWANVFTNHLHIDCAMDVVLWADWCRSGT